MATVGDVKCIVLVKQVPDVSNIPEEAWDREKGTLRRAMLDSVLNPLDLHPTLILAASQPNLLDPDGGGDALLRAIRASSARLGHLP